MPVIMFERETILVVFDNTFVADQHDSWFDMSMWTRVRVDRDHPTLYRNDPRGDSYVARFSDTTFPIFIVKDL